MATNPRSSLGPVSEVTVQNNSGDDLILSSQKEWYGSGKTPVLPVIQAETSAKFIFVGNSKAGIVYAVKNDIKWVIAWNTMTGESDKVYTDITNTDVTWDVVESLLDTSTSYPSLVQKFGYTAAAKIDRINDVALLTATLQ